MDGSSLASAWVKEGQLPSCEGMELPLFTGGQNYYRLPCKGEAGRGLVTGRPQPREPLLSPRCRRSRKPVWSVFLFSLSPLSCLCASSSFSVLFSRLACPYPQVLRPTLLREPWEQSEVSSPTEELQKDKKR